MKKKMLRSYITISIYILCSFLMILILMVNEHNVSLTLMYLLLALIVGMINVYKLFYK